MTPVLMLLWLCQNDSAATRDETKWNQKCFSTGMLIARRKIWKNLSNGLMTISTTSLLGRRKKLKFVMPVEQVIEEKRSRLAERAREARGNFERGSAKTGTLRDLMEDLDTD
jgi:hypothetical protein